MNSRAGWLDNPLPIIPAARSLGIPPSNEMKAQIFQNAGCNWRCWYCYVDFNRLTASRKTAEFFTAAELIAMYQQLDGAPPVIVLSGGQPDLIPEWTLWMMRALRSVGIEQVTYLWGNDNLSNDYFWRYLSDAERQEIAQYRNYGRACCLKGFDSASFVFNTRAEECSYELQFEILRKLVNEGLDVYCYVTFTSEPLSGLAGKMDIFLDKLQAVHPNMPLRTIPLRVEKFSPGMSRLDTRHHEALSFQDKVNDAFRAGLKQRFDNIPLNICDVSIR